MKASSRECASPCEACWGTPGEQKGHCCDAGGSSQDRASSPGGRRHGIRDHPGGTSPRDGTAVPAAKEEPARPTIAPVGVSRAIGVHEVVRARVREDAISHPDGVTFENLVMPAFRVGLRSPRLAAKGRSRPYNVRIWTPPHFASTPSSGDEVRLLTYIRPLSDLDQPRSGHDGLFARRLLIALSGFAPVDICRLLRRRFDLFAILRSARNRGDTLLDQSGRAASGRHVFRFVVRAMPQHRPRDSGQLVCERRRRNVRM